MEEAQYDIPWELKTRAICALRARPHSANDPSTSCAGLVKVSTSMSGQPSKFSPCTPDKNPKNQHNPSTSTLMSLPQDVHQHQRVKSACLPIGATAQTKNTNYPQVQISHHQYQHPPDPQISSSSHRNGIVVNTDTRRPPQTHQHASSISAGSSQLTETSTGLCRHNRFHFDEATMVHEQMDRVEAEKWLETGKIGDYLLRRRPDGNLAVSLRASDTVMHIKLERRQRSLWVLGEGPAFNSIGSVLRFYTKTALPIRGAEHVLLKELLLVGQLEL